MDTTKKRIHFLHLSPVRLRIEIDALRKNTKLVDAIQSLPDKLSGMTQITASTVTGSVLISYGRVDPAVLQRLASIANNAEVSRKLILSQSSGLAAWLAAQGETQ